MILLYGVKYFLCISNWFLPPTNLFSILYNQATAAQHGAQAVLTNIILSGFFFYIYNEFAFTFMAHIGAVTSSILNTAKRVIIIIVVSCFVFSEPMTFYTNIMLKKNYIFKIFKLQNLII